MFYWSQTGSEGLEVGSVYVLCYIVSILRKLWKVPGEDGAAECFFCEVRHEPALRLTGPCPVVSSLPRLSWTLRSSSRT